LLVTALREQRPFPNEKLFDLASSLLAPSLLALFITETMSKEAKERFGLAAMLMSRMSVYEEYERKRRAQARKRKAQKKSQAVKVTKTDATERKQARKTKKAKKKAVEAFFDLSAVESDRKESDCEVDAS